MLNFYTINEQSKDQIKKKIPFTTMSRSKLPQNKVGKGLYAKNYKMLLKDITDYFIFLIQNINYEFLIQNIILYYKINGKHLFSGLVIWTI